MEAQAQARKLAKRLVRNREQHGPWDALPDASQEHLQAGATLRSRDMTQEEREAYRSKQARRREKRLRVRKERQEQIAQSLQEHTPEPAELRQAGLITALLSGLIEDIVRIRARKYAARLGTLAEDCVFPTFSATNRAIAHSIKTDERPSEELLAAAEWLAQQPGIPDVNPRDEGTPSHAGWLVSVIQNNAKAALRNWYERNPSLESIDALDTLEDSPLDDPLERFQAERKIRLIGHRGARPGEVDPAIVQEVVAGALTARGRDALAELILANLRTDGTFPWRDHAEAVFKALGFEDGWRALQRKTDSPDLHARYAKGVARRTMAYLPPVITTAVDMLESGALATPREQQLDYVALFPDPEAAVTAAIELVTENLELDAP